MESGAIPPARPAATNALRAVAATVLGIGRVSVVYPGERRPGAMSFAFRLWAAPAYETAEVATLREHVSGIEARLRKFESEGDPA